MINTSESRIIFNGNGTATEFPYSFAIINDTDVKVMTVDPDGVETVLDSDYYVDVTAGKVIYPGYPPGEEPAESERPPVLPTGWQLVVYRDIPITQEANLGNVWPFNVIEDALDKITMILQTSRDTSDRSLKVSESTPNDVDVVVPVAPNMALKWDAQGKKIVLTKDPAEVLPIAENLLQQATQQANIATEQAGIATNKANAAAESAVSAATSETNAGAHEDKAQAWAESATSPDGEPDSKSAKTWASESLDSAELAQKWAESDESPDGEPDSKSAKTWAEEAAQSASNAATSETNAANSATEAAGSASAADSSASTATTQAGIATTKAAEAASSATSALDSKNAASTSAGNAATSEENAASSATAASNSASAAAASAQEAAEIAGGIGNPVLEVTESNGTVTVEKSDGTSSSFNTIANATKATQDGNGNNIADTYATKSDMNTKAPLESPTFTGSPKSTTPASSDNSTRIATTAFVKALVGAANNGGIVSANLAQNGYVKFANGFILQWGFVTGGSLVNKTVTLPITAPSQIVNVHNTHATNSAGPSGGANQDSVVVLSNSQISVRTDQPVKKAYWLVLCY